MNQVKIDVAYSLGVQYFKKGGKRIPAWDEMFLKNCLEDEYETAIPYLESWRLGWDHANLGYHNDNFSVFKNLMGVK